MSDRYLMKQKAAAFIKYIFLAGFTVISLYPFIWVLFTSLKDNNDIYGNGFGLPKVYRWSNYTEAWKNAQVGVSFFNSLTICLSALVILILITSMGSYAMMRVKKSNILTAYFSLGVMIPIHTLLIPTVILFGKLHLMDNHLSLVIAYIAINISISLFILNGFFAAIPAEIDEAAIIDGSSRFVIFFKIMLPLAKPGIATVATLSFLNCWNDLVMGLVLISTPAKRTLSMSISVMKGAYVTQYGILCAGFVISIVPVVIMYLLFQKQIIAGMTAGAVKG